MQPAPTKMADAILREVQRFQQEFIQCHFFLAANSARLAELLREAESRGILLHEAFALADVGYWLEHIDWQTRFLSVVLGFVKDPSRKTLRPLIELNGRDRDRMRAEAEILAQQLRHRLDSFAQPADAASAPSPGDAAGRARHAAGRPRDGCAGCGSCRPLGTGRACVRAEPVQTRRLA